MPHPIELADRYVAVWNEPDAAARRVAIGELWAEDGRHILQPPGEVVKAADDLGLTTTFEARGHEELERRVRLAYEEFVAPGEFAFRRRGDVARLRDVVKFSWEMVATNGDIAGVGTEFLVLDGQDRIVADYQFIEG
ncbi:hypothetical protein [Actinokineospora globicatena]|uniref:hypothetical protein n=1 Tax=Actinokineospora globicatena TaxID=103729 RepID=UPI0020A44003|nr:hypothetical protein [Actinokineospora globicatena]MCP2306162.1 hypothetical protein [Actinokineospora globicatena]GLW79964.1 hypothetical protein Aglo01_44450 [Actinokineospora globicatena]GLW86793.1 hypothetical protein Aglo02_44320 [Actinokineospora globicatena]